MPDHPDQPIDSAGRVARTAPDVARPTSHAALVLASASPRRRELLAALGFPFDVTSSDVDEAILAGEAAGEAAVRLARAKAGAVAWREWDALVIGADTVVVLDGRILGKPANDDDAWAMLRALRGREHAVITGVAVCDSRTGETRTAAPLTAVDMRDYADDEIAASIAAGTPFDKAGAYAIQDATFSPVERIEGCYCNVVGLPLWTVRRLLFELNPAVPLRAPSESRPPCRSCPLAGLPLDAHQREAATDGRLPRG
jgi:septum formation protein